MPYSIFDNLTPKNGLFNFSYDDQNQRDLLDSIKFFRLDHSEDLFTDV